MRRYRVLVLAGVLPSLGMVLGPAVASASAEHRSGHQTFRVSIYEVFPNGQQVGTGPIDADGVIDGKGVIQEIPSTSSDPANSQRVVLTFARGSLTVLSSGGTVHFKAERDCTFTVRIRGSQADVLSGTGAYAHATGHSAVDVNVAGVLERNPDGSCNQNGFPRFDTVRVVSTGNLKL